MYSVIRVMLAASVSKMQVASRVCGEAGQGTGLRTRTGMRTGTGTRTHRMARYRTSPGLKKKCIAIMKIKNIVIISC